ncbi:MAG TPA: amidohydrolase family protein [Negativicutes bacterium]|nr:amidohydrolase family protein [Negativicutes bacterium]
MNSHLIYNASIVTPRKVIENGSVLVDEGIITAVGEGRPRRITKWCNPVDGRGRWLIPGTIDLHDDFIEKEVEPRPNALIPLEIALFSLESRLLGHGITSIFHSLSFMEGDTSVRSLDIVIANIDKLNRYKKHGLIRHFVHARYDVTHKMFCSPLIDMIEEDKVQMISFMDHTPGQGQYKDIEVYRQAYRKFAGMDDEVFMDIVAAKQRRAQAVNVIEFIDMIAERARRQLNRRHVLSLAEAVNMATLNPAKAIFRDKELGSIEPGKAADLVLVEEVAGIPFVDQVYVKGLCVLSSERSLCGRINGVDYNGSAEDEPVAGPKK